MFRLRLSMIAAAMRTMIRARSRTSFPAQLIQTLPNIADPRPLNKGQ